MTSQFRDPSPNQKHSELEPLLTPLSHLRNLSLDVLRAEFDLRRAESSVHGLRLAFSAAHDGCSAWQRILRKEEKILQTQYSDLLCSKGMHISNLYREMLKWESRPHGPPLPSSSHLMDYSPKFIKILLALPARVARSLSPMEHPCVRKLTATRFDKAEVFEEIRANDLLLTAREPATPRTYEPLEGLVVRDEYAIRAVLAWTQESTQDTNNPALELSLLWVTPIWRRLGLASCLLKRAAEYSQHYRKDIIQVNNLGSEPGTSRALIHNGFRNTRSRVVLGSNTNQGPNVLQAQVKTLITQRPASDVHPSFMESVHSRQIEEHICKARRALIRVLTAEQFFGSLYRLRLKALSALDQERSLTRDIAAYHSDTAGKFDHARRLTRNALLDLTQHSGGSKYGGAVRPVLSFISNVLEAPSPQDVVTTLGDGPRLDWRGRAANINREKNIRIRNIVDQDIETIVNFDWDTAPHSSIPDGIEFESHLATDSRIAKVSCCRGTPVGILLGTIENRRLTINSIFTDVPYRGQGFGRALLQEAIAAATKTYCSEVVITVSEVNSVAIALLLSSKFSHSTLIRAEGTGMRDRIRFSYPLTQFLGLGYAEIAPSRQFDV